MTRQYEDELEAIDAFIELIERVSRSPYQRDRVLGAAKTQLSGAGLNALRLIARSSPIQVNEVARRLGVDQSTASRQIRPLEDAGLIERTADGNDRRVALLAATDEGLAVLDRVHRMRRDDIDTVLRGWTERDRAELAKLLDRFKESMLDPEARRPVTSP